MRQGGLPRFLLYLRYTVKTMSDAVHIEQFRLWSEGMKLQEFFSIEFQKKENILAILHGNYVSIQVRCESKWTETWPKMYNRKWRNPLFVLWYFNDSTTVIEEKLCALNNNGFYLFSFFFMSVTFSQWNLNESYYSLRSRWVLLLQHLFKSNHETFSHSRPNLKSY